MAIAPAPRAPPAVPLAPLTALSTEAIAYDPLQASAALERAARVSMDVLARIRPDRVPPLLEVAADRFTALPSGRYVVGARAGDEDWLAGSLSAGELEIDEAKRPLLLGEGVVVHRSSSGVVWHRVPAGPQLAIAAVGPGEAWAVGAGGSVVHFEGAQRRDWRVGACWLRAVWAYGPRDVWIAGDGATLLHWDGRELRRVALPRAAGTEDPFSCGAG